MEKKKDIKFERLKCEMLFDLKKMFIFPAESKLITINFHQHLCYTQRPADERLQAHKRNRKIPEYSDLLIVPLS